jgi:hypothetical protein
MKSVYAFVIVLLLVFQTPTASAQVDCVNTAEGCQSPCAASNTNLNSCLANCNAIGNPGTCSGDCITTWGTAVQACFPDNSSGVNNATRACTLRSNVVLSNCRANPPSVQTRYINSFNACLQNGSSQDTCCSMVQDMFLDTCAPATISIPQPRTAIEEWFRKHEKWFSEDSFL